MAHFVTCVEPTYYLRRSMVREDNDPVNLDFCTSISKNDICNPVVLADKVLQENTYELVFDGVMRKGKTVSWLFDSWEIRDREYDRIGKEQLRR